MSFEPAGYHHGYHETAPRSLHPMTRRQDSQQRKTNSLQSSSGFAISLVQRLFIRNLLERKIDGTLMRSQASCASRGEDSVVGNYLASSTPPSASSSSSQW